MSTAKQIADEFFRATASGDTDALRQICTVDFSGRQNGGSPMGVDALLGFTRTVLKLVRNFRYENRVVTASDSGFIEEHDVVADLPDGSTLRLPACVVAETKQGQIHNMREYFDSRAAAGLLKLLAH